ncbi:DUF3040 domain-containing protein [Aquiluna sp.]|jgi:hypothetical protein|nr:DUF3040 domain-containing protein [Aquiluna sp.]MDB4018360.1 DUF3040 domain-containing protein [Aquiluna sp.]
MALSEQEQKLLEEMERNLIEQDAGFANRVREVGSANKNARKLVVGVLTMIVGLGLLVFAVALQVAFFGVAAFLVMVIGLVIATSNFQLPGIAKSAKPKGGQTFFEDRWNQRFDND